MQNTAPSMCLRPREAHGFQADIDVAARHLPGSYSPPNTASTYHPSSSHETDGSARSNRCPKNETQSYGTSVVLGGDIYLKAEDAALSVGSDLSIDGDGFGIFRPSSGVAPLLTFNGSLILQDLKLALEGSPTSAPTTASPVPAGMDYCPDGGSTSKCSKQSESKCPTKWTEKESDDELPHACVWDDGKVDRIIPFRLL